MLLNSVWQRAGIITSFGASAAMTTVEGDFIFAALSPCGKFVATCSSSVESGTAKVVIWSLETGTVVKEFAKDVACVENVAWSSDGKQIAASLSANSHNWQDESKYHVRLYDVDGDTFRTIPRLPGPATSVAWAPGSDSVVIATGVTTGICYKCDLVKVDLATGKGLATKVEGDWVWAAAYSPDGKYIAAGVNFRPVKERAAHTGAVHLFKTGSSLFQQLGSHDREVRCVSWSPDSKLVVAGDNGGNIHVWPVDGGWSSIVGTFSGTTKIPDMHRTCVDSVSWSPNGKHITSSSSNEVLVWDVCKGYKLLCKFEAPMGRILSAQWTPDSRRIVVLVCCDGVHIWSPFE